MRLTTLRALLALATILNFALTAAEPPSAPLDAEAFQKMVNEQEGTVLDVRTPKEYLNGHISGAKLMNVMDASFASLLSRLPREKTYLIYCRSGNRSKSAAEIMKASGFGKVYELKGGLLGWREKQLPLCDPMIQ